MKEYKIAKGWAIFIYVLAPLLIGLFAWLMVQAFQSDSLSPIAIGLITLGSLAMIAFMTLGVLDTYKGKITITEDKLIALTSLSQKELLIEEIKGYRINKSYIVVEAKDSSKKRISISLYFSGTSDIISWLDKHTSDLNALQVKESKEAILNDPNLGWDRAEREVKLRKARRTSKIINWTGALSAAWCIFYPTPYEYAILLTCLMPIIALFVSKSSNGLIRIDTLETSAYPSTFTAILFPTIGIFGRAVFDFDILSYTNAWPIATGIAFCLVLLMIVKQKEINFKSKTDFLSVGGVSILLFIYSLGIVTLYNCYYDTSEAKYYTAKVLSKRKDAGKTTSYYFKLTAWGPQKENEDVSVGSEFYNRTKVGDEVHIYLMKGKIGIPWYIVDDE